MGLENEHALSMEDTLRRVDDEPSMLTSAQDVEWNSFHRNLLVTTNTIAARASMTPEGILLQRPEELTEDVQILSVIGAGAFAVVYSGVYQGADVAIKLAVTDGNKMRWDEAFLATQLRHPHVVNTYVARGTKLSAGFLQSIYKSPARKGTRAPAPPADLLPEGPSEDGLGNPRKVTHELQGWRDVLSRCGAAPNKCLLMLVQELCDQGTLSGAIRAGAFREGKGVRTDLVARRMLLRTATEICRGMIHLHAASVIHGDLKPANVLLARSTVDRRGFVAKIADFGLARLLQNDASRVESSTLGTVPYMSPEALNGQHSKAGDVYAFGMLLWEMVTGQRPYEKMLIGQIMLGVSFDNLRPTWPKDEWPELCELGAKCLAHAEKDRPDFRDLEKSLVKLEEAIRAQSCRLSAESRRQSAQSRRQSTESRLQSIERLREALESPWLPQDAPQDATEPPAQPDSLQIAGQQTQHLQWQPVDSHPPQPALQKLRQQTIPPALRAPLAANFLLPRSCPSASTAGGPSSPAPPGTPHMNTLCQGPAAVSACSVFSAAWHTGTMQAPAAPAAAATSPRGFGAEAPGQSGAAGIGNGAAGATPGPGAGDAAKLSEARSAEDVAGGAAAGMEGPRERSWPAGGSPAGAERPAPPEDEEASLEAASYLSPWTSLAAPAAEPPLTKAA